MHSPLNKLCPLAHHFAIMIVFSTLLTAFFTILRVDRGLPQHSAGPHIPTPNSTMKLAIPIWGGGGNQRATPFGGATLHYMTLTSSPFCGQNMSVSVGNHTCASLKLFSPVTILDVTSLAIPQSSGTSFHCSPHEPVYPVDKRILPGLGSAGFSHTIRQYTHKSIYGMGMLQRHTIRRYTHNSVYGREVSQSHTIRRYTHNSIYGMGILQSPLLEWALYPYKNDKRALLFSETPNSKDVSGWFNPCSARHCLIIASTTYNRIPWILLSMIYHHLSIFRHHHNRPTHPPVIFCLSKHDWVHKDEIIGVELMVYIQLKSNLTMDVELSSIGSMDYERAIEDGVPPMNVDKHPTSVKGQANPQPTKIAEAGEYAVVQHAAEQEAVRCAVINAKPLHLPEDPDFPDLHDDTVLWASWSFKIHNLDYSGKFSAQLEAGRIIDQLPPLSLEPAPFSGSEKEVLVPMQDIEVQNADALSNRFQSAAAVRFPGAKLQDGSIDPRCLDAVMSAVKMAGHECAITSSPGNDRCTTLNYEIRPPPGLSSDSIRKRLTQVMSTNAIRSIFSANDCICANTSGWTLVDSTGIARGNCTDHSPRRYETLAANSPYPIQDGFTVHITQPPIIQPTYFTTIALYIGNRPSATGATVRYELDARTAKFNRIFNKRSYIGTTLRTLDSKFVLLDPSEPALAKFLCSAPTNNGYFCRAVYSLNESIKNFEHKMEEHRDEAFEELRGRAIRGKVRYFKRSPEDSSHGQEIDETPYQRSSR